MKKVLILMTILLAVGCVDASYSTVVTDITTGESTTYQGKCKLEAEHTLLGLRCGSGIVVLDPSHGYSLDIVRN